MQIFHLGFHKTATSSLQCNIFRYENNYYGLHQFGTDWLSVRDDWFSLISTANARIISLPRKDEDFIFSDESTLLRLGGLKTIENSLQGILDHYPEARFLLSIRKQSELLLSTYFQSLYLRENAVGFSDLKKINQRSLRFTSFDDWWSILLENKESSLCGLLSYKTILKKFRRFVDESRIILLPFELLLDNPLSYKNILSNLGNNTEDFANKFQSKILNSGDGKKLKKMSPFFQKISSNLDNSNFLALLRKYLTNENSKRIVEKIIYSGHTMARDEFANTLIKIDNYYAKEMINEAP